jgi:haloalkane dehalogenase
LHAVPQPQPAPEAHILANLPGQPGIPDWLRGLYPFRTRTIRLGDYDLSLVDEGPAEAPVFVLLHGNYTWSFLFRDLIGRLRSRYRVVAPDMIGFGLSGKPESAAYHTLRRHVLNFTCLLEALEFRRVTLVLHGWGGPIGLAYAGAHPQNVNALVLANTWGGIRRGARNFRQPLGLRLAQWGRAGRRLDTWFNLSLRSAFASFVRQPVRDLVLEAYTYPFRHRASRAAIVAWSRMFRQPDEETIGCLQEIEAGLKNITVPADILSGAHDSLLGKLPAYLLRDALKQARHPVFWEKSGHFLPEEAPEVLAETVLRSQQPSEKSAAKDRLFKILP